MLHLSTTVRNVSAGIFAIVGVLLGSISTYWVQSRMAGRAEAFEVNERRRQERLNTHRAFAAVAMDARRAQINRWYQCRDAGRDSAAYADAKAESYRGRTEARRERYRVELVASDEALTERAQEIVASLGGIHKGASKAEMEECADTIRALVDEFVTMAANQLGGRTLDGRPH